MPFQSNLFRQNLNRNKIKQQKFFNKPPHYCYIVTPACGQCGPLRGLLPASVSRVQAPSCHYTLSLSLIVFRYCRHRTDTGNTCSVFSLTFLHNFNYQPAPAYLHTRHCKMVEDSYSGWALLSFGGLSPKLGIYPQFRDTISSSGIYQFPSQSIPMVSLYRGQSKKLKLAILIFQIKYQIIIITISFQVQMYA